MNTADFSYLLGPLMFALAGLGASLLVIFLNWRNRPTDSTPARNRR